MAWPKGKPRPPGAGRKKGAQNKNTKALKDMILESFGKVGGAAYLAKQAKENPSAYMTLLGKVLPLQLTGEGGGPVTIERIERVVVDPQNRDR